jgi:hypothetical protein
VLLALMFILKAIMGTMLKFRAVSEFHVGLVASAGFENCCATSEQEGRVWKRVSTLTFLY